MRHVKLIVFRLEYRENAATPSCVRPEATGRTCAGEVAADKQRPPRYVAMNRVLLPAVDDAPEEAGSGIAPICTGKTEHSTKLPSTPVDTSVKSA